MQKKQKHFKQKNVKITKRENAFKALASTNSVEILNSFNLELRLKDTESAVTGKLIQLLTQLKGLNS